MSHNRVSPSEPSAEHLVVSKAAHEQVYEKSTAALTFVFKARASIPAFANLSDDVLHEVATHMTRVPCAVNDVIVEQGTAGENFFIVESGHFQATKDGLPAKIFGKGQYFGELALLRNAPRAATVRCAKEGSLWALDRATFRECVMSLQIRVVAARIPFLSHLSAELLGQMTDAMFEVMAEAGDVIIQQGDHGDNFYLVESGSYEASRVSSYGQKQALRVYSPGEGFGERALMQNVPRAATVRCSAAGRLWALDRLAFRTWSAGLDPAFPRPLACRFALPPLALVPPLPLVLTRKTSPDLRRIYALRLRIALVRLHALVRLRIGLRTVRRQADHGRGRHRPLRAGRRQRGGRRSAGHFAPGPATRYAHPSAQRRRCAVHGAIVHGAVRQEQRGQALAKGERRAGGGVHV
jgi:CRP-like cAMP-binding protein